MTSKRIPLNRVVEILDKVMPILDKYDSLNVAAALSIMIVQCGPKDKAGFLRCMEAAWDNHR